MNIRWFTFCTTNSPYEKEAMDCADAFKKYDITVCIVPYKATGNWMKNCMQRARILSECAHMWPHDPLGIVDSDIRPVADPLLMKGEFPGDLAAHYRGPKERENRRYCAGLVVFGATIWGRMILKRWSDLCITDPSPEEMVREQVYLTRVIDPIRKHHEITFLNFGDKYNRSPEEQGQGKETVLVHYESSRFYGAKMGGPLW